MNVFLNRQLSINHIVCFATMLLVIILTSCSAPDESEIPTTSEVPDSQTDIEPTATSISEQSPQIDDLQGAETDLVPTDTPEPTVHSTVDSEETSAQFSEQEDASDTAAEAIEDDTSKPEQPSVETFTFSTDNQIAPESVLQEIAFALGAGGPDEGELGHCEGTFEQPDLGNPIIENPLLHERINIHTCGWQTDENVTLTITYPDGRIHEPQQIQANDNPPYPPVSISFKTDILNDPPGDYEFAFSGESGTIKHLIAIQNPEGPQLYWNEDGTIILYNFEPEETVEVFAYTSTDIVREFSSILRLYAWQSYQVDQNGNLIIEPQFDEKIGWYASIGHVSGEVRPSSNSSYIVAAHLHSTIVDADPDSAEICQLTIDDTVSVPAFTQLWSHSDVVNSSVVASVQNETQVSVLGGPIWGSIRKDIELSGWWWIVSTSTDEQGWVQQEEILDCSN